MMLIALFGVELGWLPFGGISRTAVGPDIDYATQAFFTESLLRLEPQAALRALARLVMPALALSTIPLAVVTRMTRSAMLEEVGKDYVTTARAKGLPERRVVGRHVLRNALVPVVTITGLQLGALLSGAVLTETVFDWPGLGTHLLRAATQRNYPVVMATMLLFVGIFVLVNLVVDLLYHLIDPRMRHGGAGA
jgi:ABC-type dipeptide/oligopeptide/nickel transport system permease component